MISYDTGFKERIEIFRRLLAKADVVLIGAGSGLSADAGIDYTSPEAFARKYPAMLQYGYRTNLDMMAFDQHSDPGLFWGYYLNHGRNMRFGELVHPVYQQLLEMVSCKTDYFVLTTNVDAFFVRNGFEPDRIYTPQGDYGRIQCFFPCSDQTWSSEPIIKGLLPSVDSRTGRLPEELVPTCPNCGGTVFYNVRGGEWFVDAPYEEQQTAFFDWLQNNRAKRMLLIEIGAGFNTPVWIRWPFERITRDNPDTNLVRINRDNVEVPEVVRSRSITFQERAAVVLESISRIESYNIRDDR